MRKVNRVFWFRSIIAGAFLLPVLFFFETSVVSAASEVAEKSSHSNPEFGGQWVWALISLVFVAFLAYWSTKFLAGKLGSTQAKHIKVAESLCLGPNRHLYLLLVNNQVMLVGSSEHGLSLLKEFQEPAFYESLNNAVEEGYHLPSGKFMEILMPLIKGNQTAPTETLNSELSTDKDRLSQGLERIRAWRRRR